MAQYCLNAPLSSSGHSAYQLGFGSNPADLHVWRDGGDDLLFVQETSISGQFAQQWRLRMMARKAALREMANSESRRLFAHARLFDCPDVKVGDWALFYKSVNRRWFWKSTKLALR